MHTYDRHMKEPSLLWKKDHNIPKECHYEGVQKIRDANLAHKKRKEKNSESFFTVSPNPIDRTELLQVARNSGIAYPFRQTHSTKHVLCEQDANAQKSRRTYTFSPQRREGTNQSKLSRQSPDTLKNRMEYKTGWGNTTRALPKDGTCITGFDFVSSTHTIHKAHRSGNTVRLSPLFDSDKPRMDPSIKSIPWFTHISHINTNLPKKPLSKPHPHYDPTHRSTVWTTEQGDPLRKHHDPKKHEKSHNPYLHKKFSRLEHRAGRRHYEDPEWSESKRSQSSRSRSRPHSRSTSRSRSEYESSLKNASRPQRSRSHQVFRPSTITQQEYGPSSTSRSHQVFRPSAITQREYDSSLDYEVMPHTTRSHTFSRLSSRERPQTSRSYQRSDTLPSRPFNLTTPSKRSYRQPHLLLTDTYLHDLSSISVTNDNNDEWSVQVENKPLNDNVSDHIDMRVEQSRSRSTSQYSLNRLTYDDGEQNTARTSARTPRPTVQDSKKQTVSNILPLNDLDAIPPLPIPIKYTRSLASSRKNQFTNRSVHWDEESIGAPSVRSVSSQSNRVPATVSLPSSSAQNRYHMTSLQRDGYTLEDLYPQRKQMDDRSSMNKYDFDPERLRKFLKALETVHMQQHLPPEKNRHRYQMEYQSTIKRQLSEPTIWNNAEGTPRIIRRQRSSSNESSSRIRSSSLLSSNRQRCKMKIPDIKPIDTDKGWDDWHLLQKQNEILLSKLLENDGTYDIPLSSLPRPQTERSIAQSYPSHISSFPPLMESSQNLLSYQRKNSKAEPDRNHSLWSARALLLIPPPQQKDSRKLNTDQDARSPLSSLPLERRDSSIDEIINYTTSRTPLSSPPRQRKDASQEEPITLHANSSSRTPLSSSRYRREASSHQREPSLTPEGKYEPLVASPSIQKNPSYPAESPVQFHELASSSLTNDRSHITRPTEATTDCLVTHSIRKDRSHLTENDSITLSPHALQNSQTKIKLPAKSKDDLFKKNPSLVVPTLKGSKGTSLSNMEPKIPKHSIRSIFNQYDARHKDPARNFVHLTKELKYRKTKEEIDRILRLPKKNKKSDVVTPGEKSDESSENHALYPPGERWTRDETGHDPLHHFTPESSSDVSSLKPT